MKQLPRASVMELLAERHHYQDVLETLGYNVDGGGMFVAGGRYGSDWEIYITDEKGYRGIDRDEADRLIRAKSGTPPSVQR